MSRQRAKALRGEWPGGTPPFGYRLEGAGRDATPVPDDRERAVIRTPYDALVRDGMSTGETAALLNGLELFKRSGGLWTHQRLRRQMESRALTGEIWWGLATRRHSAGHHTKLGRDGSPKYGEPLRIDLADPPLTVEEYDALQAALARRAYGVKSPNQPYPNSGANSACGGRFGGEYRRDRNLRQYRCSESKWRADARPRCGCARVDAEWLDGQVWAAVTAVLSDADRLTQMADDYLGLRRDQAQPEVEVADDLDRRIANLEQAKTQRAVEALWRVSRQP